MGWIRRVSLFLVTTLTVIVFLIPRAGTGQPPTPPVGFKYDPRNEFTDEFTGTHLNYSKWMDRVDVFFGNQPAYWERDNVSVSGGTLKIETKFETPVNAPPGLGYQDFTAGIVMSRAQATYGYFEVRAKVQDSRASSAFWFFGFTFKNTVASEIDVFEIGGGSPGHEDLHHINLHHVIPPDQVVSFDNDTNVDLPSDFHVYGVDWQASTIRFYYDGVEVFSTPNTYWSLPLNLIMDTETLTAWFGTPLEANLPTTHEIDYVRGWQLVPDTDPNTTLDPTLPPLNNTNLATTRSIGSGWDGAFDVDPVLPASEYLKVVDHNDGTTVFGTGDQIQIGFDLGKLTSIDEVRVKAPVGTILKVFHGDTAPFNGVFPGAGFHLIPDTTFQVFDGGGLTTRFFMFISEKNTEPVPGITEIEIIGETSPPAVESVITYKQDVSQTNHTTGTILPAGNDRALVVCVTAEQAGGVDLTVSSMFFNGTETCTVIQTSRAQPGHAFHASHWYCPAVSAATAAVDYTHAEATASTATVIALSNASQSNPTLGDNADCDLCGDVQIPLTTTSDNTMLMTCAHSDNDVHTHGQGAGQVEHSDIVGGNNNHRHSTSSENKTPIGAETLTTTITAGPSPAKMTYTAIGIPEAGAAPAPKKRRQSWLWY